MAHHNASPYSVRRIDGDDEADAIQALHAATSDFPQIDSGAGWWWFADFEGAPVGYIGMIPSTHYPKAGYFARVGVLTKHRGNGLQLRLMRAMERYARKIGFCLLVSDTTETVHSANNFIKAGWSLFDPQYPWAFSNTLYWRKDLA